MTLSLQQAFDAVYTSRLFEKLSDPKTGLFFQSSGYVYSYLIKELERTGQNWLKNNEGLLYNIEVAGREARAEDVGARTIPFS